MLEWTMRSGGLRLPKKTVREIHCTFNDDVNEDLINLHHHRTPFEVMPELVRHYRIEVFTDGTMNRTWRTWTLIPSYGYINPSYRMEYMNGYMKRSDGNIMYEYCNY
ncbi:MULTISPECIES: hypothetical protein [unclassified Paenibacillus]|uniref:hypothetical protein n=1 Tax=unclassified Paenibacillus TaxID=185978 RepID=UPI0024B98BC6|nr:MULTISPECIES: hypothetical protein [unclassified Paenibacillus]